MADPNNSDHQSSINANIKAFHRSMVDEYDARLSIRALSVLFARHLIEFDVKNRRTKTPNSFTENIAISDLPAKAPAHSLVKPGINIIDFACGTGIVTEKLVPYLSGSERSHLAGMDINDNMLRRFDERMSVHRLESLQIGSYKFDVLDENQNELAAKFTGWADIIVCTISYHHLHNYEQITKKLATFLKRGGWLFIYDFYNKDVEKKNVEQIGAVAHMGGLKIDALNNTLGVVAGLTNVSSAEEFKVDLWQQEGFLRGHMPQDVLDKLDRGELQSRKDHEGMTYLVTCSVVLAIGQRE